MIVGRMGRGEGFWASHKNHTYLGARTARAAVVGVRRMYRANFMKIPRSRRRRDG